MNDIWDIKTHALAKHLSIPPDEAETLIEDGDWLVYQKNWV
jgi:hypothetical protein